MGLLGSAGRRRAAAANAAAASRSRRRLVGFDREDIVTALPDDGAAMPRWQCSASAVTTQAFSCNSPISCSAAAASLPLGRQPARQRHAGLRRPGGHHDPRHMSLAALVGPPQRFAVDRYHTSSVWRPRRRGKGRGKAAERRFEGRRIEQAENARKRVVARHPVRQRQHRASATPPWPRQTRPSPSNSCAPHRLASSAINRISSKSC